MADSRMFNRRVLLINPPQDLKEVMGRAGKFVTRWEPLGLLYIAAVLIENGYDVCVLDAEADPHTPDEVLNAVGAYDPAVVGITCLTPTAPPAVILGQRIRETYPQRTVVMGNVHAHVFAEILLRLQACQFVVHGDGEFVFLELLRCIEAGGDAASVGGVSFLKDTHYVTTPPPPLPRDLDVIAPPARHLVKHIIYDAGMVNNLTYLRPKGTVSRHAVSSRGCVFRCKFCVVHQERRFRSHSPKRVVDEIVDLQDNYNCGFLFFVDPIFVGNKKRVHAVCDEIHRRGIRIPWGCEGHVRMVDRPLLQAMKTAGCVNIAYGIESGSQRMLHKIGKDIDLEHVTEAVRLTQAVGIPASGLFILGLPGETREEMEQTIELAAKLPLDLAQFSMYVPYPGSEDYAELSAAGIIDAGVRPDGSVDLDVWRRFSPYVGYGELGSSIYLPPGFTFDELFALQRRALRRFYLRPRQIWQNVKRLRPHNVIDATCAAATMFFKQCSSGHQTRRKTSMFLPRQVLGPALQS
jgi:magnesium-protoporphyrin IX monomethyl ester (oxidative) cyclase